VSHSTHRTRAGACTCAARGQRHHRGHHRGCAPPGLDFDHPTSRRCIDEREPFAVLATGILHHLNDAEHPERIAAIRDRLTSGRHLVITNFLDPGGPRARALERAFLEGGLGTGRFRTREQQIVYFDGLELVEPGSSSPTTGDPTRTRRRTARCTRSTRAEWARSHDVNVPAIALVGQL